MTEIAAALGGAAVGVAGGDVVEVGFSGDDVVAEGFELSDGLISGGVGDDGAFWILPGRLATGALVLYDPLTAEFLKITSKRMNWSRLPSEVKTQFKVQMESVV
nr:hypothetical protein Iba_chr02aCG6780 [Ipomoea batatas]GME10800.1 hypothetical protein Iba_scaffold10844CG0020 [Ipomoea batatas]